MNKQFLFLLAWASGSDSEADNLEPGEYTRVSKQEDLIIQFEKKNESIFALDIWAPDAEIASALGYKEAFFENYTAHDAVSSCEEVYDAVYDSITKIVYEDGKVTTTHGAG